jgi:outer membrane protein OmpA-like peptidoglycan-associated protein
MDFDNKNNDGSDNFWPGYVDAVTNLVLNLLFLLTIMTVAVFMFALELGRASLGGAGKTELDTIKADSEKIAALSGDPVKQREAAVEALKKQVESLKTENPADADALKKKAEAINKALDQELSFLNAIKVQQNNQNKQATSTVVPATVEVAKPPKSLARLVVSDVEVLVVFKDEAIKLTDGEQNQLRDALKNIAAAPGARISVEVPTGFTEAKRLGFYRAMEVRNKLIEMKMSPDRIDVSVREGKISSNASIVRVSPK